MHRLWILTLICVADVARGSPLINFGPGTLDEMLPEGIDSSSPKLITRHKYQIFFARDRRVYVNDNGLVSLHDAFDGYVPSNLPVGDANFAAVFWADHYVADGMGKIWYRLVSDRFETDAIRKVKNAARDNFDGCNNDFKPKRVLVVTWEDVYSFEYVNQQLSQGKRDAEDRQKRTADGANTYQLVMGTDGVETFVMFNYEKIEWTSSNGNFAVVGFNDADNLLGYQHPHSVSQNYQKLVKKSNVGVPGRWVYKTSGGQILGPGCEVLAP